MVSATQLVSFLELFKDTCDAKWLLVADYGEGQTLVVAGKGAVIPTADFFMLVEDDVDKVSRVVELFGYREQLIPSEKTRNFVYNAQYLMQLARVAPPVNYTIYTTDGEQPCTSIRMKLVEKIVSVLIGNHDMEVEEMHYESTVRITAKIKRGGVFIRTVARMER